MSYEKNNEIAYYILKLKFTLKQPEESVFSSSAPKGSELTASDLVEPLKLRTRKFPIFQVVLV